MAYAYHIGVDYHKAYSHIVVQDSAGKTLRSGRVRNDSRSVAGFLSPFSEGAHAVLEATRNWTVMFGWLDELCDEVVLAHPLKVKAIAEAKIKTDKIDATILAHLLRADLVPAAHASSHRAREVRLALRERMFYVRLRTMVKNRVVTAFDRYPEQIAVLKQCRDLFGTAGRKQLAALEVSAHRPHPDRPRACLHRRYRAPDQGVRDDDQGALSGQCQCEAVEEPARYRRVLRAIDDIARFRSAAKLAAYAGLVPSTYSSGGRTWHGRIIKQGNKWLRWAFVKAVAPAVASDPDLKAYYERLKATKGANRAKVATARRLLTIAFQLLRDGRSYERCGAGRTAKRNHPGCLDRGLASPARPGCALQENGKPGPNATL